MIVLRIMAIVALVNSSSVDYFLPGGFDLLLGLVEKFG